MLALGSAACGQVEAIDTAANVPVTTTTPAPCVARVMSRLFFGQNTPDGTIAEPAWQGFVDDVVTPRFGDGLTVLQAHGQWRNAGGAVEHEASRVIELVHDDSAAEHQRLAEIASAYRTQFRQEAVLLMQSPVRACLLRGGEAGT